MFRSGELKVGRLARGAGLVPAALLCVAWTCLNCAAQTAGTNTAALSPAGEEQTGRRPLVVLKQSSIKGRVFFLVDNEDEDSSGLVASQVSIRILSKSGGATLHETKADDQGQFTLPNLDVGTYQMVIGRLRLELSVREQTETLGSAKILPKTILIYMPKNLGD